MKCENFDQCIADTFTHYGPIGVKVTLLSVDDRHTPTPPGDWVDVTVVVEPVVPQPVRHADTWHYGGVITVTHGPVPLGVREIDTDKLIGCCEAAKKLPPGFLLPEASGGLFWPIAPGCDEPFYQFRTDEACFNVGAYSGKLL